MPWKISGEFDKWILRYGPHKKTWRKKKEEEKKSNNNNNNAKKYSGKKQYRSKFELRSISIHT